EYFLALAEKTEPKLFSAEQLNWFNAMEVEHANFRAGLDWSLTSESIAAGLRLAGALHYFWSLHGHHIEGYERLVDFLSRPEANAKTALRAKALNAAGFIEWFRGNYVSAREFLEEALSIAHEVQDLRGVALALRNLGPVVFSLGEYNEAGA